MAREITYDLTWDGTTNTDFGTGTNYEEDTAPQAGDHILISSSNRDIAGSDETATDLATVWFDKLCARPAGSTGSPLILACNNVVVEGSGKKVIKAGGNGIDYLTVNMNDANQEIVVHPAATNLLTNLFLMRCRADLAAEAGVITLGRVMSQAYLKTEVNAGGFTTLLNDGGEVLSNSLVTTLYNKAGGRFTQDSAASATVTNAHCDPGSVFNFDYEGTITLLTAGPGAVVDLNRNSLNKTITTLVAHPDAVIRAGIHVTISNLYYGEG